MNLYVENLAGLIAVKEANSVPYRPVHWYRYSFCFVPAVPASYRLCRPHIGRAGKIRLFRLVNGYQVKKEKSQRKILTNFKNLPKTAAEPEPLRLLRLLPLLTTQTHRSQPLKTQLTQPMNKNPAAVSPSSA